MESKKEEARVHTLSLTDGEKLVISDVVSVPAFDNEEVEVRLSKEKLKVTGDKLEIDRLDLDEGVLELIGKVKGLMYYTGSAKKNFLKRVLK